LLPRCQYSSSPAEVLLAALLSVQQPSGRGPPCCPVVSTAAVRQESSLLPCLVQQQQPGRGPPSRCCPVVCLVVATAARSLHRHLARIRRKWIQARTMACARPGLTSLALVPCRTSVGRSTLTTPRPTSTVSCKHNVHVIVLSAEYSCKLRLKLAICIYCKLRI